MKLSFFKKHHAVAGVDISTGSMKSLQFSFSAASAKVQGLSEAFIPKGVILNDDIADEKTLIYLLKQIITTPQFGSFTTRHVVANIPETKSFVRVIQIPKMSEHDAENAVPFEAESFIPLPIDQVYLDWQKLGDIGEKMNILIIASPKEYVDRYLSVLDKAGLTTVALEVESQSILRALLPPDNHETMLIADISASRTTLIMVEDGHLQFTSTIPIAGDAFTDTIAKGLGISTAKAEAIKRKIGIANTAEYPNIKVLMLPVLNNLAAEMKNILKFQSEHSLLPATKIILTGGGAKLVYIDQFIASEFSDVPGIKVELSNVWNNVSHMQNPPLDFTEALSFATVIGLAKRGLVDEGN